MSATVWRTADWMRSTPVEFMEGMTSTVAMLSTVTVTRTSTSVKPVRCALVMRSVRLRYIYAAPRLTRTPAPLEQGRDSVGDLDFGHGDHIDIQRGAEFLLD